MSTVVLANPDRPTLRSPGRAVAGPETDRASPAAAWPGFVVFLLLNAVLLIRPAETVQALVGLPIYEVAILACVVLSCRGMVEQLRPSVLQARPINVCALGMLSAVLLSHLAHFRLGDTFAAGFEFAKLMVYYLLLIALVTTLTRLRSFLFWLTVIVMVLATVALLQYHGVVNIPGLEECQQRILDDEDEPGVMLRLVSVGIYNDPNDLCLILSFGIMMCLYWLGEQRAGPARILWVLPLGVFAYALMLTHSRGGFMGLVGGLAVLFHARFGWKKAIPLIAVTLPLLLYLFAGRQTNIDLSNSDDTAQARILIWRDGLALFREAPLFGIGAGRYVDEVGFVAHNSFVHCFTELGFFGGTLFAGGFVLSAWGLYRVGSARRAILDPEVARLHPYLLAGVVAYIIGMLSLSRAYVVPTYLTVGLASAYLGLPAVAERVAAPRMSFRLLAILAVVGLLTLASLSIFVRLFAR
jgi:O-antigen ligase